MKTEDYLDIIKVNQVDVPPFLFTRIQGKLEKMQQDRLSKKKAWAISAAFIVVLFINFSTIIKKSTTTNNTESYVKSMNIVTDNHIYK